MQALLEKLLAFMEFSLTFAFALDIIELVWINRFVKIFLEGEMAFSYNKLWKVMIDKKMIKKDLIREAGITSTTVAKLSKDLPVSMEVLGKICHALNVNVGDIVDYIDE